MQLTQLERTIELLRQKLAADTDSINQIKKTEPGINASHPLIEKIQETIHQIEKYNKEYQRRLNKGIEHFNRFEPNRTALQ